MGYFIEREISDNGYATVSLGAREEGGRGTVVVKRIRVPSEERYEEVFKQYGYDKRQTEDYFIGFAEDLSDAVNALATISQKNGRHILNVFEHKGAKQEDPLAFQIDIVTEYLTPLDIFIKEKGMSIGSAVQVGIDACEGLMACHANDVIHGGIKEKNIFVSEGAGKEATVYKLGDIGISRILWDPTQSAQDEAAPYTAPEVFKGEYAEEAADIYAVGIILFKLFNDMRMPFAPLTPSHVVGDPGTSEQRRRGGEIPPLPRKAGERLGNIIRKACGSKDRRHKTAKVLRDELKKYLDTLTDTEKNTFVVQPPGTSVPGRRAMGQARASRSAIDVDDMEQPQETSNGRINERVSERLNERPSVRLSERRDRARELPTERISPSERTHDRLRDRTAESYDEDFESDHMETPDERPPRPERARGSEQPRGTRGARSIRPEKRARAEDWGDDYRRTMGRKGSGLIIAAVLVIVLAGFGYGGYLAYNYFFNDPISAFAKYVEDRDFESAAQLFDEKISDNAELADEAGEILVSVLSSSVLAFAAGDSAYEAAHGIVRDIENTGILDDDILLPYLDRVMEIFESVRAFDLGRDFYEAGSLPDAITQLGRVQPGFHGYDAAMNLREDAARQYKNSVFPNLGIEAGTVEAYENAIETLNAMLRIMPGDEDVLEQINHCRQHLDVLMLYAEAGGNGDENGGPEEPGPAQNGNRVENQRFNYGNNVYVGTYTGAVNQNNRPHGFGTFTFDGQRGVYTGEWANGLRHGQGRNEFRSGHTYDGNWVDGWFTGQGTMRFSQGHSVTGSNWSRSALIGQAVINDAQNRKIYEGAVTADQTEVIRQGQGTAWYEDGSYYEGAWSNNQRHGTGTLYSAGGDVIFTGNWVNGERTQ
ncbi:MAG: protein kinase [Defluviitaleaceae bacterium]|nr:protein kinase [Defluviitaleaceae bacterium]MCL2835472.1 protein kinase [Defluviitaleaceae bacterium]